MSLFSKKLKEFIEQSGETVYQISKKAGINRTVIHKALSGERVPNQEFLEKLYRVLMLSPLEIEELNELRLQAKTGDKIYFRRQKVREVIERLARNPLKNPAYHFERQRFDPVPPNADGLKIIKGHEAVVETLLSVFGDTASHFEAPFVYLYLPFEEKYLYELLYNFYLDCTPQITIKHLVYIEKENRDDSACQRNLESLSTVFTFALNSRRDYEPYYFYGEGRPLQDIGLLMPYFVMTNHRAVTLTADMEYGFLYDTLETVAFFREQAERIFEKAPRLIERAETIPDMYGWSLITAYEKVIEPAPCMGKYFTRKRLEAFIKDIGSQREALVRLADDYYGNARKHHLYPDSIFAFSGLENFMETGVMTAMPRKFVRPLTKPERLEIAEELRKDIAAGDPVFMAVDQNEFHVPLDTEIIKTAENEIAVRRFNHDGSELTTIFLRETGIVEAFTDFLDAVAGSRMVYSKDQLLEKLDALLEKFKKELRDA